MQQYLDLLKDSFGSITFIDWDKPHFLEELSQFLDEEQILGMLRRDNVLRKLFQ